jgi:type IV pilus assembly protein PilY1
LLTRRNLSGLVALAAVSLPLVPASTASAQINIKIREPNVMIVLDTSASMAATTSDVAADCQNGDVSRYFMSVEALTGTVIDPYCISSNADGSDNWVMRDIDIPFGDSEGGGPGNIKVCVPAPNDHSDVWNEARDNPGSWGEDDDDPIVFRRLDKADLVGQVKYKGGGHGHHGHGHHGGYGGTDGQCDIGQYDDGVIDTFKDRLRFGFASTDPLQKMIPLDLIVNNLPVEHSDAWTNPWTGVLDEDKWMLQEQGYEWVNRQHSYWWLDASNRWDRGAALAARPGIYGAAPLLDPSFAYLGLCPDLLDNVFNAVPAFVGCRDSYDIGIRNSHAAPWTGRLMGFGASAAVPSEVTDHNDMIEHAIMAVGPYARNSSPLAAMMRDVHEFMRNDTTSTGAELPFATPSVLGPSLDPLIVNGCREQAVIFISDGKQQRELAAKPADYSAALKLDTPGATQEIKTYVVGVGPTTFTWGGTPYACKDINLTTAATAFAAGGVCEYNPDGYTFKNAGTETAAIPGTLAACCTMADLAIQGGTNPRFASDESGVRKAVLDVGSQIAGDTLSRTVPVHARAFGGGTLNAPAVSYEILSALNMNSGGGAWEGYLHRLRHKCGVTGVEVDPLDAATNLKGDKFEENLKNVGVNKRYLWTVVVPANTNKVANARSIRLADYSGTDGLKAGTGIQTAMKEPHQLAAEIKLKWGAEASTWLGLQNSDRAACESTFGTGVITGPSTPDKLKQCAGEVLKWYGGQSAGSGVGTTHQRTSPLGAIWRSNPVVVTPPQPNVSEESFSAEVRTGTQAANPSFVTQHKQRPTMSYVQTIDGMLHAFVVQRNAPNNLGPFPEYYDDVPPADDGENNELWSFLPPAVSQGLWPNFDKNARLLDGPITVRDVNFKRTRADRQDNVGDWRTVLVASGGYGAAGGFYYAIDITNPVKPKFLWQLSTQDDNKALFGQVVPGAAIATLRVKNGVNVDHVAVAILPGGEPVGTRPSSTQDRQSWSGATASGWKLNGSWSDANRPRKKIRNWGGNEESRSVTIVELETGKIIGRMVGQDSDQYSGITAGVKLNKDNARFDSPMSGTPIPYPDFPSQPASRVYMGDDDGTLWRLDFQKSDPALWEAQIAWDPYNDDSLSGTRCEACTPTGTLGLTKTDDEKAVMGQPIQLDHLLVSTDENGDPVVMFSTGDQEQFQAVSPGMVNYATSFVDPIRDVSLSPPYDPNLRTEIAFKDGDRVLGPMTLFDGKLYMSYFEPDAVGSCVLGNSGWCAFDYNDTAREGFGTPNDKRADAVADIDRDGTLEVTDICAQLDLDNLIFGMTAFQEPSCELSPTDFGDAWFGGNYSAYTTSSAGQFSLFMHNSNPTVGGDDAKISTATQALATPKTTTRIVSWTNVVE